MTDIVERLCDVVDNITGEHCTSVDGWWVWHRDIMREAADEITRLRSALSEADEKAVLHASDAKIAWAECEALRAERAQALKALVEAAKVCEAPISNQTFDRFLFNGDVAKNTSGHDLFMSVDSVTAMLGKRAAVIRALITDTGHTEGEQK